MAIKTAKAKDVLHKAIVSGCNCHCMQNWKENTNKTKCDCFFFTFRAG